MATYTSNTSNGFTLRLIVKTTSQNSTENKSRVSWRLELRNANGVEYSKKGFDGELNREHIMGFFHGKKRIWTEEGGKKRSHTKKGAWSFLASGAEEYGHDETGRTSVKYDAYFSSDSGIFSKLSVSATYTVNRIPQKPIISGAPTVTYDRLKNRLVVKSRSQTESAEKISDWEVRLRRRINGTLEKADDAKTMAMGKDREKKFRPEVADPNSYVIQTRAKSKAGWGGWSNSTEYTPRGNGPRVRDTTWKRSRTWIKIDSKWRPALAFTKQDGKWRQMNGF